MSNSFYHKDLTDGQWNRIKFLFEEAAKIGRPPLNPRRVFNAIMWILKSDKERLWCKLGLFERLLKVINGDAKETTLLSLLSTEQLLAFPTKPISRLSMTLIRNCTNNATSSKDFFREIRTTEEKEALRNEVCKVR